MTEEEIWIEKYRPKKLKDVIGQTKITDNLKIYSERKNIPHLMFSGPPGVGKTASAIALAKEIFGETWGLNFKELNASDERGINVVREQIKDFAKTESIGDFRFKIIFLDEADALTNDAQAALRRTIERYTNSCRFILSCNYSSKVIEPIQSRVTIYRFKGISSLDMKNRLKYIAEKEKLKIDECSLDAIVYIAEGDMRRAINCLETASLMDKDITIDGIYKSSGLIHPQEIIDLINLSLKGNFIGSVNRLDTLLIEQGLSGLDIIKQMFRETMNLPVPDKMKIELIDKIGEVDFRISEGANEMIQMKYLITQIIKIGV